MSCILHIETSTSTCSVAVSEDGQNVFKKEDLNGPSHAVHWMSLWTRRYPLPIAMPCRWMQSP